MRIGILASGFPPEVLAGAQLQAQQVAEELAKIGHQVNVFTRSAGFYPSRTKQNGYTIHPRRILPVFGARTLWDIIARVWDIARCRPRPEVLLCYQTMINGLIGAIAQILLGVPTVVSIRGNKEYRRNGFIPEEIVVFFVYRKVQLIILQTPRMLEDMHRVLQTTGRLEISKVVQAKARIIPNGIYLPTLPTRAKADGSKVIYIGRLIPGKGVADLIAAIKQLPHAELLVVGDGPDRIRLETLASGTSTTFVGTVSHEVIADYLQQARVLVLPSPNAEGLPNVILEAMSFGVPVVAANVGGIPDVVRHGETGYLCESGNVNEIASYVGRIMVDDDLHHKLSAQSLQAVRSYSWSNVIPQIEQVLLECLQVRRD